MRPPLAIVCPPTTSSPPRRTRVLGSELTTKTLSGLSASASMIASMRLNEYGKAIPVGCASASTERTLTFWVTLSLRFLTRRVDRFATWSYIMAPPFPTDSPCLLTFKPPAATVIPCSTKRPSSPYTVRPPPSTINPPTFAPCPPNIFTWPSPRILKSLLSTVGAVTMRRL
jgi:hypothetical protein